MPKSHNYRPLKSKNYHGKKIKKRTLTRHTPKLIKASTLQPPELLGVLGFGALGV